MSLVLGWDWTPILPCHGLGQQHLQVLIAIGVAIVFIYVFPARSAIFLWAVGPQDLTYVGELDGDVAEDACLALFLFCIHAILGVVATHRSLHCQPTVCTLFTKIFLRC